MIEYTGLALVGKLHETGHVGIVLRKPYQTPAGHVDAYKPAVWDTQGDRIEIARDGYTYPHDIATALAEKRATEAANVHKWVESCIIEPHT